MKKPLPPFFCKFSILKILKGVPLLKWKKPNTIYGDKADSIRTGLL
jgi:hypothetical protein